MLKTSVVIDVPDCSRYSPDLPAHRSGIASVTLLPFWTGCRYLSVCLSYESVPVLTDVDFRYEACRFIHIVVLLILDTRILPPIAGTWRDSYVFYIF